MTSCSSISSTQIRARFSEEMSSMFRTEVPQYGALLDLVSDVNAIVLHENPELRRHLSLGGELELLECERHGAIRLGTKRELFDMRRIFSVMGMFPVGYYDLSSAGIPVHATAFRPVDVGSLVESPFRMFTSLLRLELIEDVALREEATQILQKRRIFSSRALDLTSRAERYQGLNALEAEEFVSEIKKTFQWQREASVDAETYKRFSSANQLLADIVCFHGPHINHLTPRTLNIDAAHSEMPIRGMVAKEVPEGPPLRRCPILLRQTSFKAVVEEIAFSDTESSGRGTHASRFGEIEQRGMALTPKGRRMYDEILSRVQCGGNPRSTSSYMERLSKEFKEFPDDYDSIRRQGLGFFYYSLSPSYGSHIELDASSIDLDELISAGLVVASPIVYEDFLPVSAAGIFQSNLSDFTHVNLAADSAKSLFESALGIAVLDEFSIYQALEDQSLALLASKIANCR